MEQYIVRLNASEALQWDGLSPTASWVHIRQVSETGVISSELVMPDVVEAGVDAREVIIAHTRDGALWKNSSKGVQRVINPAEFSAIRLQSPAELAAARSGIELQPWKYNVFGGKFGMLSDVATSQTISVLLFIIAVFLVRSRWQAIALAGKWVASCLIAIVLSVCSDGDISIVTALLVSCATVFLLRFFQQTRSVNRSLNLTN